jgi:L-aspartate oxidase
VPTENFGEWRSRIAQILWLSAGICREQGSMAGAIAQLQQWRTEFDQLPISQQITKDLGQVAQNHIPVCTIGLDLRDWGEVRNLLDVGLLILESADFRTESRGGHFRNDYSERDDLHWQAHTLVQGDRQWKSAPLVES